MTVLEAVALAQSPSAPLDASLRRHFDGALVQRETRVGSLT
jgi:hypothetical protein